MDQLPPNTIIGGILALFAILGFLRKFVSFFFNLIALALGAVAGLYAYNNGFLIAKKVVDEPAPWMPIAIGIATFILTIVLIRGILGFLSGKSGEGSQVRTGGFGLPGGVFGLLFGVGIAYFMLTGVRYAGTVSELNRLKEYLGGKTEVAKTEPLFIKLKDWIDQSQIGQWHQKIDFLNDPAKTQIAKIAVLKQNPDNVPESLNGASKEIIYDAIPVDGELEYSISEGDFSSVLHHQRVRENARNAGDEEALMRIDIERELGLRP